MQSITLSNSTTTIYNNAFYNCISLTKIVFPSTLTNIGESVFYGCKKLDIDSNQNTNFNYYSQMLLSNRKTTIIEFFGNDINLEITAPPEATTIGARTFMNKNLKTIKFQGNLLSRIGEECFSQSTIQTISLPDSLNNLGASCFENCQSLTSISFSNSCPLTVIPENCFKDCKNLQILTLPTSITTIKANAFLNCYSISDIGLSGTQVSNIENYCFMNSGVTTFISSNKITLGYGAFTNSNIAEVNIFAESISEECFKNCTMLTSLTLNEGTTTIFESAFRDCVSLALFTIPASIKLIRFYAFMGCTSLKIVTLSLNSKISEINGGTFADCPLLQSIKLDPNDKQYKFSNGALTYYNETKVITFIPSSNIQTFVVQAAMEKIGSYSFYACTNLVKVIFSGSNIDIIDYMAFYGCSKLSYIFLGTNTHVSSIGSKAFEGCPLLNNCGAITCPTAIILLFEAHKISRSSFRTDCNYICQSIAHSRSGFTTTITLITPFILM